MRRSPLRISLRAGMLQTSGDGSGLAPGAGRFCKRDFTKAPTKGSFAVLASEGPVDRLDHGWPRLVGRLVATQGHQRIGLE